MNKTTEHFIESGVPTITAENMFRAGEKVHIHLSADCPEFVGVLHKHEFIEIVYVISGKAVHKTAGGSYPVSRGDVIIVNFDTPHAFYEQEGSEKFMAYDLMFKPDFLDTSLFSAHDFNEMCSSFLFYSLFPKQQAIGPDLHLAGFSYEIFGDLFHKIYMEFTGQQKGYQELVRVYIIELIIKMFRKLDSSAEGRLSSKQKEAVSATVTYLKENYHNHITLEELAMRIFLSKDYLNRIFREAVGLPVNAFLQKLRVEEACRLLSTTDIPVLDVAVACGFSDSKFFYAVFKRIMHMTPGEYRAQSRK
ncbi:MAG: helix-turn-helix domain-containing protein [Lachnospiraceae bacterium]|nr:helix-turn-helix domain-containing protein [Lachnospiraceae bacterium]